MTALTPIGQVRSSITDRKSMPAWGAPAQVEVFPAFAPALHQIEKHTHLWVLAWLDGERDVLKVKPRGCRQEGDEALHGVFAVRSPARPNPIGLTAARVLARDGLVLHFDRLDFVDSTPVIDLKPYFAARDLHFAAHNEKLGAPVDLREGLIIQAVQFHGAYTPEVALAVEVVHTFLSQFPYPDSWQVAAPRQRPEIVDALMGITRTTLGRRTLTLHDIDAVVLNGREFPLPPPTI
jgi:tRNA (adenine37-N6)-methyltransferase